MILQYGIQSVEWVQVQRLGCGQLLEEIDQSSSNNLHAFDPEIDRTLHRLRKVRSTDPNIIDNTSHEPEKMKNNDRILKELAMSDVMYQSWCIQYPQLEQTQSYELKSRLIHLLQKFQGLAGEDPHKHVKEFHVVCSTMRPHGIPEDYIKMKAWNRQGLAILIVNSVQHLVDMKRMFLEKFFPASRTATIQKEIYGLIMMDRNMIDVASGRVLMDKTPIATRYLISNMASNTQQFGTKGGVTEAARYQTISTKCTVREAAVSTESESRVVYGSKIRIRAKHAAGSEIPSTIVPTTTTTIGSITRQFTFDGRVDEAVELHDVTDCFDFVTDVSDSINMFEVQDLSNSMDNIANLTNFVHIFEFSDLTKLECRCDGDLECSRCARIHVADTKRPVVAQVETVAEAEFDSGN
ncbi:hypothetical protein CR513_36037, partial [Mucuna pruriens]